MAEIKTYSQVSIDSESIETITYEGVKFVREDLVVRMSTLLDPENQPTQFGTVTQKMYDAVVSDLREFKTKAVHEHFEIRDTIKVISTVLREHTHNHPECCEYVANQIVETLYEYTQTEK